MISDPNKAESTGKEITTGYMVIEDFDYLPYAKESYDDIYIKDTNKKDSTGNSIYGLCNIYNSNPQELTELQAKEIIGKVLIQESLMYYNEVDILQDARTFLMKYIANQTDKNIYDCKEVLKNSKEARDVWAEDVYYLMLAAESCLEKDKTIIIAQTPENQTRGIDFRLSINDFWNSTNNYLAIHSSKTRTIAKASYDGEFYEIYENWGIMRTKIFWKASAEERDAALNVEKNEFALGLESNIEFE